MNGGLSLTLLTVTSKTSESNNTVWKTKIFFATHILFEIHFEKFLDNNGLFNTIMRLDFVQFQLEFLDFYTVYNNKCLNSTFHQTWSQCR